MEIHELEALIRRTLAAAENARESDRPPLMAQVDTLTRERDELVIIGQPNGYAIGSDGEIADVVAGVAYLDGI